MSRTATTTAGVTPRTAVEGLDRLAALRRDLLPVDRGHGGDLGRRGGQVFGGRGGVGTPGERRSEVIGRVRLEALDLLGQEDLGELVDQLAARVRRNITIELGRMIGCVVLA